MSSWALLLIIVPGLIFAVALEIAERVKLRRFFDRPCAGILWHRRFPSTPHDEIRAFLRLFADAFALEETHRSKLTPDDQPLQIYKARYVPHLTLDDWMEFESLADVLHRTYAIDLQAVWRDELSLGELFALTRATTNPSA